MNLSSLPSILDLKPEPIPWLQDGYHWRSHEWVFRPDTLELEWRAAYYFVDLERMTTSAQMLDTIFQVAQKTWADERCVGDLVRKLNTLLNPQGTLCSSGVDKWPIDVAAAIRRYVAHYSQ